MIERITFFSSPSDSVPPLLLWSAQREVFFHPQCCHCPSLSLSLLMLIWSRHTERNVCMCVCVCVYVFMLLRYFLCLLRSVYFRSLPELLFFSSPKYLSPHPPLLPLSPSLSLSLQAHKKSHTIGCYGIRLPCSSEVFTWSSSVCACLL